MLEGRKPSPHFAGGLQALSKLILCILLFTLGLPHSLQHFAGSSKHCLLGACLELLSPDAVKAVAPKLRQIISLPCEKHP